MEGVRDREVGESGDRDAGRFRPVITWRILSPSIQTIQRLPKRPLVVYSIPLGIVAVYGRSDQKAQSTIRFD